MSLSNKIVCSSTQPETFQIANERADLLRNYENIKENEQSLREQVMDARGIEDFNQVDQLTHPYGTDSLSLQTLLPIKTH